MMPFAVLALSAWAALLLVGERVLPLRAPTERFAPRLLTNATLATLQLATAAFVVIPVAEMIRAALGAEQWDLIPALELGAWTSAAFGIALLDGSFYLWHRANHRLPFLWRFHRVHHSDPDLDLTTALRFHPGEVLWSLLLRLIQVLLLGVTAQTFLIYAVAFQAAVLFHHADLRLPARLDRALGWLIVTPRLHGVHHSRLQVETDSNFGVLTSLWDRMARTLRRARDDSRVRIGLDEFPTDPNNRPLRALAMPFRGGIREA